jgi:hypothetical protein
MASAHHTEMQPSLILGSCLAKPNALYKNTLLSQSCLIQVRYVVDPIDFSEILETWASLA